MNQSAATTDRHPTLESTGAAPASSPRRIELEAVRAMLGHASEGVSRKIADRLSAPLQAFIARSPFLTLSTGDENGRLDCSPRGDAPGFVRVLSPTRLVVPDRPGNNLLDSMRNIAASGQVGIAFFVPGVREVARVNGTAYLTDEPELLATMSVGDKVPRLGIVVDVQEAYIHCGRAILRSALWRSESQELAIGVPTIGEIYTEQVKLPGLTAAQVDEDIKVDYRELY